jgi:hypothetical protein
MAIHLVGETIDAKRAHQRAQGGELIPLVRGVYVDHDGDAEAAILGHAVRIAHYLYPNAYLSSASAVLLAPTSARFLKRRSEFLHEPKKENGLAPALGSKPNHFIEPTRWSVIQALKHRGLEHVARILVG